MNVKDSATSMMGTVAKPSSPSVKLTAFEDPIITNKPNGIKNIPRSKIRFLKKIIRRICKGYIDKSIAIKIYFLPPF